MIRVERGRVDVSRLGAAALESLRPRAEMAVFGALLTLEGEIKLTLSQPGTGIEYPRGKAGRTHRASAPGEPPAVDTGRLRNSITHEGPTWSGDEVSGRVGTNVEYADDLEYGTSKMAPRPYVRPTVERVEPAIRSQLGAL